MKSQMGPYATSARYDAEQEPIVVVLNSGSFFGFEKLQGLQGANGSQLNNVVVEAQSLRLNWPDIDADLHVPTLMDGSLPNLSWN
ncbi:hypothetical protein J2W92_005923 [Rhizobium leguminosarum]|uniref:DUF2442 domain-containing protein n=1 Tax=Rhizobium leguminosarum TaxID=384 RepID=UPI0024B34921|nr:DUF2442 domain-containing protein [Rhizobium leguminosarum]WHO84312.1 DUF2442 domain-containing protein [Rhizobium leguminosarum]